MTQPFPGHRRTHVRAPALTGSAPGESQSQQEQLACRQQHLTVWEALSPTLSHPLSGIVRQGHKRSKLQFTSDQTKV